MTCSRLAMVVLLCGACGLYGQTPATTPAQLAVAPSAPKLADPDPSSPTVSNGLRYLGNSALLTFCSTQLASWNDRSADVIFIGDSITQGWRGAGEKVWQANYAANSLDFGIGGDRTENVLWRLEQYPLAKQLPKVAVILIGTNNFHNTAPDIASGVLAVIAKTKTTFPGIKTILVSIMPNQRGNDLTMAANALLKPFADDKSIFYLDLVPLMTPVGDNWKGLGKDHLHPNESGYQLWADALNPLLNRLLGKI